MAMEKYRKYGDLRLYFNWCFYRVRSVKYSNISTVKLSEKNWADWKVPAIFWGGGGITVALRQLFPPFFEEIIGHEVPTSNQNYSIFKRIVLKRGRVIVVLRRNRETVEKPVNICNRSVTGAIYGVEKKSEAQMGLDTRNRLFYIIS